jgi:GT2 family glycosyltransferase
MPSGLSKRSYADVAVVVLNWNGASDTLECLRSLRQSRLSVHAIVVDNGSTDDSVEEITASGLAGSVIETGENLGFAEGNNVGVRLALEQRFPVIAVLNNDTIVEADSFEALVRHFTRLEYRALSPDIRYFDAPSQSWFAGGVLDNGWPRHLQPSELVASDGPLRPSDCLSGCCIVAQSETWKRVGLFDPDYFLIFEDSDWSLRARHNDVNLYVVTDSIIRHKISRSHALGRVSLLSNFYFVRNGLAFETRYFKRHIPRFVGQWLVRPSITALARRMGRRAIAFRWLGALAFAVRLRGRAPQVVERLAELLSPP